MPAFEDAIKLRKYVYNGTFGSDPITSKNTYIEIIAAYSDIIYVNDKDFVTKIGANGRNPFFQKLMPAPGNLATGSDLTRAGSFSEFIGALGGTNVTALADGLAKFLAERTKEELEIAFFSKLKKFLSDNDDFKILLPKTTSTLSLIDQQIYDFKKYINMIREGFHSDLKALPDNLLKWLKESKSPTADSLDSESKAVLTLACSVVAPIIKGAHPGAILNDLAKKENESKWKDVGGKNLSASVAMLDFFSQSLRSNDASKYWVSKDVVLEADPIVWRIYFGLLLEQSMKSSLTFDFEKASISSEGILKKVAEGNQDSLNLVNVIESLINTTEEVKSVVQKLKNSTGDEGDPIRLYDLFESFFELIHQADQVASLVLTEDERKVIEPFVNVAQQVSQIVSDIHQGHYSAAVADLALLMKELLGNKEPQFVQTILEYCGFLALLIEAESADDVNSAIKLYALPAGSSRIKKESNFNIALQAYVGGLYQFQKDTSDLTLLNGRVGFSAPVGISISKGFDLFKSRSSLSLFVSAVDVGSLVQFRLLDSTSIVKKDISLANIFSPGAGLVWGIPKWPLSLGATYSAGPLLRKIVDNGQNIQVAANRQWGVRLFIAVDIPILNFYNVSRGMKKDCCK